MVKHSPHTWIGACPSFINSGVPTIPSPCLQALIHPSPFFFLCFSDYATSSQASLILQKPQKGAGMFPSLSHTVTAPLQMEVFVQQWPGADPSHPKIWEELPSLLAQTEAMGHVGVP